MRSNEASDVGVRLRAIRDKHGLNQRDFAERLETSSGRISVLEHGDSMPSGEFLLRLHNEFNVDLNWLIAGEVRADVVALSAPSPVAPEHRALLDDYDRCDSGVRSSIRRLAAAGALPGSTRIHAAKGSVVAGHGGIAAGRDVTLGSKPRRRK